MADDGLRLSFGMAHQQVPSASQHKAPLLEVPEDRRGESGL